MTMVRSWDRSDGRTHAATVTVNGNYFIWCEREEDTPLAWKEMPVGYVLTCFYCIVNT